MAGTVDIAIASSAELGERPLWDDRLGELVWVDILAGIVHRHSPDGIDRAFSTETTVGAAALREGGGYVLAAGRAFVLTDPDGSPTGVPIHPPGIGTDVRFNDGVVDRRGRFWAGTTSTVGASGAGALYCLDSGTAVEVLTGVTESNGIGWSPDGGTMYFIDSGRQSVRAFDVEPITGLPQDGRVFVTIDRADGIPDGLTVDAAGTIWIALWEGAAVRQYSASGELLQGIRLPVSRVTCPGFGGSGLTDLYITTAWEGATDQERSAEPNAGSVYRVTDAGLGIPTARYRG